MSKRHFLDSGAFSLFNKVLKKQDTTGRLDYSVYNKPEFWKYVDAYANFINRHKYSIDHYVNVDACRNPKLSWQIQKYLEEEHGLKPIPVVHFNTPIKWLAKYLDAGYDYIGIGGRVKRLPYWPWADRVFNEICNQQSRLPLCKTHGFAVTTHKHVVRYPWYSVDSVTWKKMSYYGQILVPPVRGGQFCFSIPNQVVFIDPHGSKYTNRGTGRGRHFLHLSKPRQKEIRDWLDFIKVPFGKSKGDGSIIKPGVINDNAMRCAATISYFEHLQRSIPKWPWPFQVLHRPTLLEAIR